MILPTVRDSLHRFQEQRPGDDLGAAAYAIRALGASVPAEAADDARAGERAWQREQLPAAVREVALDDQRRRSALCWHVFDDGQPGSASWRAGMARSSPR